MTGRVVVIGAGASGLMAAGSAGENGARVLLLEKSARLGTKLSLTGNGRGNLTHAAPVTALCDHLGPNGRFARNALQRFDYGTAIAFWAARGVPTVCEPDGRVFPKSSDADDLVSALARYCQEGGVEIRTRAAVLGLHTAGSTGYQVVMGDASRVEAPAVILATGGLTYPQTGSTGDGHRLAGDLGHCIVPCVGGLVPLTSPEAWVRALKGVRVEDVRAELWQDGSVVAMARGDLLFTHFGLSGPVILTLSLAAARELERATHVLRLDLCPDRDLVDLDHDLLACGASNGRWSVRRLLGQFVPRAMAPILAERATVSPGLPVAQLKAETRRALAERLKSLFVRVSGKRPMREAMITVGGVCVDEIDPRTMASRVVPGLYVAGGLTDVAGDTGGYNLHYAFASGYVAGRAAAERLGCVHRGAIAGQVT